MFHPQHVLEQFRRDDALRRLAEERAAPWRALSVDALWDLVFGNTLPRSWMVWSDGPCPTCGDEVNMYDWVMTPFERPWKLTCPRCGDIFPKNDFHAFYRSGLDVAGVFDPAHADRSLLFNTDHPDADDPLNAFGVDDGHGFVNDDGDRWRFVATWLVYGQWKGLVWTGIERLAEAFAATGDLEYSRRAGVLLDRLSDVYPTFDYSREGFVYEKPGNRGYLSNWHDACAEVLSLTVAYDRVRDALSDDEELVTFLAHRASRFDLPTPKDSGAQICRNIEQRILQDTLDHIDRVESNFPTTEMAVILIEAILRGEGGMEHIHRLFDDAISRATAVDGISGEKGLSGYACIAPRTLAHYLALFARARPGFLDEIFARHPALHDLYRFHIDTWVGTRFYPNAGDCGAWTTTSPTYAAVPFTTDGGPTMAPSMFTFFWQLYETTGDVTFVQVLHHANGASSEGLPHDVCCADPAALQRQVDEVMTIHGGLTRQPSVNKREWHLAILRGADQERGPVAWLDYDSGAMNSVYAYRLDPSVRGRGAHSHADGMNLGLFYRGVDLIPDLGYPPVNFGGWSSPQAEWYKMSAAHNTVVVDGLDLANAAGQTLWWHDGEHVRGISVSAPGLIDGAIFERCLVVVDTGEADAYIVDVFRVRGGADHTRFLLGPCGNLETTGLDLVPAPDYGHDTLMRSFRSDASPSEGWVADWSLDDRTGLAPPGSAVHLRHTDVSRGVEVGICESWACYGSYHDKDEVWLQRCWLRRRAGADLSSTFAGVLEPYEGRPAVVSVSRIDAGDGQRADEPIELHIELASGSHDRVLVTAGGGVSVERDGVERTR
ncbi:MAG: heparinase II/III family protein [Candidatus Latescibacterota bacterium]